MAIPLIRSELLDDYAITLSEDAIEKYIRRYQAMLAARQQDAELLRRQYPAGAEIILCIDGIQPEKGHETLYVVRELTHKRVWFAEPLLSATEDEVRRLIQKAKEWTQSLGTSVGLWMSDKQEAFVKGIAAEFPDVPHRYCDNHFLRDLAKPVLEADSHAKVQMRKKGRGLRTIEQTVLQRQGVKAQDERSPEAGDAGVPGTAPATLPPAVLDAADAVVLDYCAAVRGILNDDQGGPLDPPGLRMAAALDEVRQSVQRNLGAKKGGFAEKQLSRLAACIAKGLDLVEPQQETIRSHVETIREVAATLDPAAKASAQRQSDFDAILARLDGDSDPIHGQMAGLMRSFRAGLFAGEDIFDQIHDNLDLERWFRLPKGHERRIHGHRHAGVRIVQEGATLVHALDAHHTHPEPFGVDALFPYRSARAPACQCQAIHRRKVMRKSRSKTKRPKLLAELERRYQAVSSRL